MNIPTPKTSIHECGGTIAVAELTGEKYHYCDYCGAFVFADDPQWPSVPPGTDPDANRIAWDAGDTRSPEE